MADLQDQLVNKVTGLGTRQDKSSYSEYAPQTITPQELENLYRSQNMASKVVDILPADATREWRTVSTPEALEAETRFEVRTKFEMAHRWARLYGTSYLLMVMEGGEPSDQALSSGAKIKYLHVLTPQQLLPNLAQLETNPSKRGFLLPATYSLVPEGTRIHSSRLLVFNAVELPYYQLRQNNFISDSILARLYTSFVNYDTAQASASALIHETNVDVLTVPDYASIVSNPKRKEAFYGRMNNLSLHKSMHNLVVLDSEETLVGKTASFSGLEPVMTKFTEAIAAGSDIPMERLVGSASSGLASTGEGSLKNYYDSVKAQQKTMYEPKLRILDTLLGVPAFTYEFNSLFQMTPAQKATIRLQSAQTVTTLLDSDILTLEQAKTFALQSLGLSDEG